MEFMYLTLGFLVLAMIGSMYWETKSRMERLERKLNALLRHHGIDLTQGPALSDRVKQLAADPKRKIEAIKAYREETGVGLAEAKEAIEAFTSSQ
ncbi:MAG TPA: ribosomal protein L7/L12 [Gemmataceae bacterium]|jgi:ribosomal protein L7/L12|nr:ribosomal protein L7/L12 [Gemmataceae bacterium]